MWHHLHPLGAVALGAEDLVEHTLLDAKLATQSVLDQYGCYRHHLLGRQQMGVIAASPSPPAALRNAKRLREVHAQQIERAPACAEERLHCAWPRGDGALTADLDATQFEVYALAKRGPRTTTTARELRPYIAFWTQRDGLTHLLGVPRRHSSTSRHAPDRHRSDGCDFDRPRWVIIGATATPLGLMIECNFQGQKQIQDHCRAPGSEAGKGAGHLGLG